MFFFLLLLPGMGIYAQCSLYEVPLSRRVNSASLIIEGKVEEKKSFWNPETKRIYTLNKIEVFKVFKGSNSSAFIQILTEGGVLENEMLFVSDFLSLDIGNVGVFVLTSSKLPGVINYYSDQIFESVASKQGFIKYNPEDISATDVFNKYTNVEKKLYPLLSLKNQYKIIKAFNIAELRDDQNNSSRMIPLITGFLPMGVSAGTKELLTIQGSGFGSSKGSGTVGFRNADDGGASFVEPLPHQYIKWTNTEIVVEVPEDAGTGRIRVTQQTTATSQVTLVVLFSRINLIDNDKAYPANMVSNNPTGGYVWQMTELFDLSKAAGAAFKRAFNTWKCNTGINWLIGDVAKVDVTKRDDINIIRFAAFNELPEGVLGTAFSYYSSCQEGRWYLSEMDIVFAPGVNWHYGTEMPGPFQIDMQTIALHELGHAHQLGHVIDPSDIMHFSYNQGTQNLVLNERNIEAGNLVMNESTTMKICSFEPMEKIPLGICEISELSQLNFKGLAIAPNPVRSMFKIKYTLAEKAAVSIEILNNLGQKVHVVFSENQTIGIYEYEVNLDGLNMANGIYYLRVYLNDVKFNYKIVRI